MAQQKKGKGTALAKWDEELARRAQVAAAMEESVASGQFFSTRGGVLAFNDSPLPGNQMAVVILDSIMENTYYEGDFDPDNPSGPTCYAFGREEKELAPHAQVVEAGTAQSEQCAGCPMNEWGTADKGRGKACKNTRRLALIPAGTINEKTDAVDLFDDEEHFKTAQVAYLRVPVTSVKGYAAFVKQVVGALRRPPCGIFTKVSVVTDPKTQFKVVFEPIGEIPDALMGTVLARAEEAEQLIAFPYPRYDEEEKPARGRGAPAKGRPAPARGRQAPPARGGRKY